MSDYSRFIYYVYNYENGHKKNNVGFSRLEKMDKKCRMTTKIRVPSMNGKTLEVALMIQIDGEARFLSIGQMEVRDMTGENRVVFDTEDVFDSGYALEEMKGLVIYDSMEKYFGSEWEDEPISFQEFKFAQRRRKQLMAAEVVIEREETEEEPIQVLYLSERPLIGEYSGREEQKERENKFEKNKSIENQMEENHIGIRQYGIKENNRKQNERKQKEGIQNEIKQIGFEENRMEQNQIEENRITQSQIEENQIRQNQIQENERKENEAETRRKSTYSENLPGVFYQFPPMFPFEDDELTDCVRIEPQDIGRLPMEDWVLANNSFLLHSYYSYRHLLLAKRNGKKGVEYVLCAPGICQNREEFMAALFGFCDFKPARKVENKTGEFGYWYMPVVLDA